MSRSLLVTLILIVAILGVGTGYFIFRKTPAATNNSPTPTTQMSDSNTSSEPAASTEQGSYVDYSADAVARTSGKRLLFFHAPWCPQCRALDASIRAGTIPSDTTIFKVDYDSNQHLRQQYGVTIQTTVVLLDDSAGLAKKYVAYDEPSLDTTLENLF